MRPPSSRIVANALRPSRPSPTTSRPALHPPARMGALKRVLLSDHWPPPRASKAHKMPGSSSSLSPPTVPLTAPEHTLCQLLDQFSKHLKSASAQAVELRIAGGWVRDKLLGVQSNDLDIAISTMTGQEFAKLFAAYVESAPPLPSQPAGTGRPLALGKIATIEARPDQSKHLETATTTFLGLELDFVQLRSEQYGDESRIPSAVTFGTPLEDATRRDITINALFYNIHSAAIEDHTGKGLPDLHAGLIRTPLPAEQTFKDDPLRLIRCIRFATRFGFDLDQDICLAAKSDSIRRALKEKISRERVGTEVDKMLKGPDPLSSLRMINDLGLYTLVFSPPPSITDLAIDPSLAIRAAAWLDRLARSDSGPLSLHPLLKAGLTGSATIRRRLFLACALTPYQHLRAKAGKKEVWAGEIVLSDSLKLGNHDKNFISHLFQALQPLQLDQARVEALQSSSAPRLELGRLLRNPHIHDLKQVEGDDSLGWPSSFLFSLVMRLTGLAQDSGEDESAKAAETLVQVYHRLVDTIIELKLPFVVMPEFDKRRLDGKEICEVLGIKPGKHVAAIIERLIDRQIEFPEQSKQAGSEWLQEEVKAGRIKV